MHGLNVLDELHVSEKDRPLRKKQVGLSIYLPTSLSIYLSTLCMYVCTYPIDRVGLSTYLPIYPVCV